MFFGCFEYSHQQLCVRWGNTISNKFFTTNGVHQGRIISPEYVNVYMDGLSELLNESGIGCKINGHVINNLMYVDDSCLISLSPAGLQFVDTRYML